MTTDVDGTFLEGFQSNITNLKEDVQDSTTQGLNSSLGRSGVLELRAAKALSHDSAALRQLASRGQKNGLVINNEGIKRPSDLFYASFFHLGHLR